MMRRLIILLISFMPALHLSAQALEKSLLWKISGNGLPKPSYIYGTVHAACEVSLEPGTNNAIGQTDRLYLELDMDDPNMQSTLMAGMNMKDGKTMQQLVSPEDFTIAEIGWIGEKANRAVSTDFWERPTPKRASNNGHAPREVWDLVKAACKRADISLSEMARRAGEHVPAEGYNPHT
ncbi:MAG: hypothetical protein EOO01_24415, partial [Chitinophagaceae bacterium]